MLLLTLVAATGAARALGAAPAAAVPFELFHDVILTEVRVGSNGPYLAMIDTGTDPSAIDVGLARELGLKLGAGGEIDGGGTESIRASETTLPGVTIGALTVRNVEALAGPMVAKVAKALDRPIRLVLGKSFLDRRIVQFDFPKKVMRFPDSPPLRKPVSERRAVLPLRYEDDVLLEGVRVDGKPVRAILDTGSNGSLKLTPEAVHRLGMDAAAGAGAESKSTGFRGGYSAREGRVERLDLGTIPISNPAATFWLPGTGHDGKPWDVNIGNAIWKDFVVTLDAVDGILVVERADR